ncbi:hypothetical protein [Cellulomonas wangsupingiae]|uniref:hypothetical protein n=1 Tax=Cellulomonas wangsupingiae TaxID=2968085 RepID=UPI001D0E26CA|nr:hypothetical protein [Cellulomonas wangsupingiae]MCM0640761.1 hypothetical protein [Cellulomonas wangsupingiae]
MSIVDDAIAGDVRAYATQVRAALADLGQDQVDDLTDGLEANLTDTLADERRAHGGSLVEEFGEPGAYAAELRTAAGLAPVPHREGSVRAALLSPWRALRELDRAALAQLRATRWFPGLEDLLVALRPAWWVLRGWALAHLLLQVLGAEPTSSFWLPSTLGGWVLLVLCVVASAQWGRGRWRTGPRWQRPLMIVSGLLAVASLVLLLTLPSSQRYDLEYARTVADAPPADGIVVDGEYAHNLFVYDAQGRPVEGAQVFDQAGRPVTTEPDGGTLWMQQQFWPEGADAPLHHVGVAGPNGETRWNVFPLYSLPADAWTYDDETQRDVPGDDAADQVRAPSWPFASAAPVTVWGAVTPGGQVEDGPTPTPTPDASPDPASELPADPAADLAPGAEPTAGDAPVPQVPTP